MSVTYGITNSRVTVLIDGRYRSILAGSAQGLKLQEALKRQPQDLDEIRLLVDIPAYIAVKSFGRVVVDEKDQIRLDGKLIDFGVVTALMRMLNDGFDPMPLVKFIENVAENPDHTIAAALYPFLEKGSHPFTEDGCFLAFKRVDANLMSFSAGQGAEHMDPDTSIWIKSTGKVKYPLEGWTRMNRADCSPNQNTACSTGLHAASFDYLTTYHGGHGRILIVKINPRDVTAFPSAYEAKLRCCLTHNIGEIPEEEARAHFSSAVDLRYPIVPEPIDWEAAAWTAGNESGQSDRANDYSFEPEYDFPNDIPEDARAPYAQNFLDGYVEGFGAEEPDPEAEDADGEEYAGADHD